MTNKLNWEKLKKHFGDRLTYETQSTRFKEKLSQEIEVFKGIYWFNIDGKYIGYFDTKGNMSYIGPHIELGPTLSYKYFGISQSRTLKRYLTNTGLIKFIENKWKGDE